ncbi:MAG: PEP-CTERM sorting domain-containing protein [Phycisphaerae bacterium]|nr:PEP-CTERM sorting domain-containing protein [Phycisphaerae bacterium]
MRKLMVLMLVAGVGGLAHAGFFLTVNGEDVGDTTSLRTFELGVDYDGSLKGFDLAITVDGGRIDISGITFPVPWMLTPHIKNSSDTHVEFTGGDFFSQTGPLTVVRGIVFNLGSDAEALITVSGSVTLPPGVVGIPTMPDFLHVVPEPAGLLLLSLGGLFLRRRK